ncbi:MAG: tryptophan--tRNA ligase [Saprospiraceae bacterium]|nr:tryptophan--tRNA ligase [Saprospiraceae bacterium]
MEEKKTVLSCIQPTGDMHFGNYFGAVQNWVHLQDTYDCYYGVVDYHAMTMPYNPKKLRSNTWDLIINLMSAGVDPKNLFIQSMVPEHAELSWIFNCFCSFGQLTRMTQFKDKSSQSNQSSEDGFIAAGLLTYPILQAADILVYRADFVPVGKDQEQHLELSRNIAQRFNNQMGKEYFKLPECLFTETPKVMSPADPTRKMSKSAGEKHAISIFADPDRIRKQIKSAVTDTGESSGEMSPGVANLFSLLKASNEMDSYNSLMEDYKKGSLKYSELKEVVAEALVKVSDPFREKRAKLVANKKDVKYQIKQASIRIRGRAQETLREVKELAGLLNAKM